MLQNTNKKQQKILQDTNKKATKKCCRTQTKSSKKCCRTQTKKQQKNVAEQHHIVPLCRIKCDFSSGLCPKCYTSRRSSQNLGSTTFLMVLDAGKLMLIFIVSPTSPDVLCSSKDVYSNCVPTKSSCKTTNCSRTGGAFMC